jgi:hypothetical protein
VEPVDAFLFHESRPSNAAIFTGREMATRKGSAPSLPTPAKDRGRIVAMYEDFSELATAEDPPRGRAAYSAASLKTQGNISDAQFGETGFAVAGRVSRLKTRVGLALALCDHSYVIRASETFLAQ